MSDTVTLSVAWGVVGVVGVVGTVGVVGVLDEVFEEPPPPHEMMANTAGARKRMCRFRIGSPSRLKGGSDKIRGLMDEFPGQGGNGYGTIRPILSLVQYPFGEASGSGAANLA